MSDSAFARVLEARRGYFNARFAQAQLSHPDLEGDRFLQVLGQDVAPVVEAVAQVQADAALVAGQHLYDLALDLFADGLLTPANSYSGGVADAVEVNATAVNATAVNAAGVNAAGVNAVAGVNAAGVNATAVNATASVQYPPGRVWREVLPGMARFLAVEPRRVAGSILNAAFNLSQTPGARPDQWGEMMRTVAPYCADAELLLRAGQVAAWRAGMAQYRLGALHILKTLDAKIARILFGLDPNSAEPDTNTLHHALMANPWYDPAESLAANDSTERTPFRSPPFRSPPFRSPPFRSPPFRSPPFRSPSTRSLRIVRRVGAFRGFGGAFLSPPRVVWTRDGFVASDGKDHYLMMADVFGATLRRIETFAPETGAMPFKLGRDGQVTLGALTEKFPELANASSATANQTTLAVTTDLTHSVYLVAVV